MTQELVKRIEKVPGFSLDDSKISPLGGGITNQNFKVEFEGKACVLRIYGKDTSLLGIDRSQEVACHKIAADLNLAPKVIRHIPDHQMLLTQFVNGRTLQSQDVRNEIPTIAEVIRHYHEGPNFPASFSPFQIIKTYLSTAQSKNVSLPDSLSRAIQFSDRIERAFGTELDLVPCHNDLLAANFISDTNKLWLLDWEYAGQGPRFFDLANLSINNEFTPQNDETFLSLYFGDNSADPITRLNLMKLVSDLRESFWSFVQCAISKLDFDYQAYGLKHYTRFMKAAEDPKFESWLEKLS